MKVAESPSNNDKVVAFVITGDGGTERKVLKFIANRYNGKNKALVFQKSSLAKKTGLSALNAIDEVHRLSGYTTFLILIDKEHFTREGFEYKLARLFEKYELSGTNPYIITSDVFRVCLVVLGYKKAIEEHIAKLIELEFNESMPPEKSAIKTFLRTKGLKKYRRLFETARLENLEKAFKPLVEAIKVLEEET